LSRSSSILNPEPIQVRLVGHPQRGQGNGDLRPGVRRDRTDGDGRLRAAVQKALHLQPLPAGRPAMYPEIEVGVEGRIEGIMMQIERLPRRSADADGAASRMGRT